MPSPRPLTARQRLLLDFISQHIRERGYPPSIRECGEHMQVGSTNGVNDHLRCLERKGYIRRDPSRARAIVLVARPTVRTVDDPRLERLLGVVERLEQEAATARLGRRPDVAGRLAGLANEVRLVAFDLSPHRQENAA